MVIEVFARIGLFAAICSMSTVAWAGPFGVTMGQPLASLSPRPFGIPAPGFSKVTVPVPNAEFESYSVISTPQTGICKIWGTGRDYDNDAYGNSVRSAYDRLKTVLEGKYGPSQEISFIRSGALWDDANEWVMSIRQKERTVTTYWTGKSAILPDGIVAITLEVRATGRDSAYLDLTYEFSNFTRCQAVLNTKSADGL